MFGKQYTISDYIYNNMMTFTQKAREHSKSIILIFIIFFSFLLRGTNIISYIYIYIRLRIRANGVFTFIHITKLLGSAIDRENFIYIHYFIIIFYNTIISFSLYFSLCFLCVYVFFFFIFLIHLFLSFLFSSTHFIRINI